MAILFGAFVLFLYGPTLTIIILAFGGPDSGLTFPMRGFSMHWFGQLFADQAVGDLGAALQRSLMLAAMVTLVTVSVSLAAGLAFRRRFRGAGGAVRAGLGEPDRAVDPGEPGRGIGVQPVRRGYQLVEFGVWRAAHLDAAVRAAHHLRRAEPV